MFPDPRTIAANLRACGVTTVRQMEEITTELLCRRPAGGSCVSCQPELGTGSPVGVVTPFFVGQLYHDTTADIYYRSTGLTSADWTAISGTPNTPLIVTVPAGNEGVFSFHTEKSVVGITGVTWNAVHALETIWIHNSVIQSFSAPLLLDIDPSNLYNGSIDLGNTLSTSLQSFSAASLTAIGYQFYANNCTSLTSVSMPSLVSVGDAFQLDVCHALVTIDLSSLQSVGANFTLDTDSALVNLSLGALQTVTGTLDFDTCTSLVNLDLGSLTSVGNFLYLYDSTSIQTLDLGSLTTVTADIDSSGLTALTTVDLSSLVTVGGDLLLYNCSNLASIALPNYVPTNGQTIRFDGCKLDAASVNGILARCVANAGFVTGLVRLNGGTNAAPTGQGLTDKATLNARHAGLAVTN